jgi:hypothetical protein
MASSHEATPEVETHNGDPAGEFMFVTRFVAFPELVPEFQPDSVTFLAGSCEDRGIDVPLWWRLNAHRFSNLARRARDYMAVPASSVAYGQLSSR